MFLNVKPNVPTKVPLNFTKKLFLGAEKKFVTLDKIKRSHRIGKPRGNRPRYIIVKFTSYRSRTLDFDKKNNLQEYNGNNMINHKTLMNEYMTKKLWVSYSIWRSYWETNSSTQCWQTMVDFNCQKMNNNKKPWLR